jgi:phage protein D
MYKNTKTTIRKRNNIQSVRAIAIVNGYQVVFSNFSVEMNGFAAANSFDLEMPFFVRDTQNGEYVLANGPNFDTLLLEQDNIEVDLYVGIPKNLQQFSKSDLTLLISGYVDTVDWDFDLSGEKVTLHGRNIVGKMIDYKLSDKYPNMTSSAIAKMFASEIGLTPVVTDTSTLAGTWYQQNSAVIGTDTTVWDLLLFLAKQENFICRVTVDDKLLFGPYEDVTDYDKVDPIPYTYGYDIKTLHIERSPHAVKNIVVKVISYSRKYNKKGTKFTNHHIEETAKSTTQRQERIAGQYGRTSTYTEIYTIPGLTRDQAQAKAQAILKELSSSEIIGNISTAGNTDLTVDQKIQLYGVGQRLSQTYYVNKVTHRFSFQDGYTCDMSISNQYLVNETENTNTTTTEVSS